MAKRHIIRNKNGMVISTINTINVCVTGIWYASGSEAMSDASFDAEKQGHTLAEIRLAIARLDMSLEKAAAECERLRDELMFALSQAEKQNEHDKTKGQ